MPVLLAKNWWSLVIRGLVAILFGLVTFAWPGITLSALVLLFGAFAMVDGILSLLGALRASRNGERWTSLLIEGAVGILIGLITLFRPGITAVALVWVIAVWAIVTGALEIAAAMRLRRYIRGEWLLVLMGAASLIFGILCIIMPAVAALAITLWIGVYAIVFGALLIGLGFRLRTWTHTLGAGPTPHPAR
ncbi:MAG: hypothetical protein JWO19_450 [Bryobacterales bacterium]|nr:hypothetical protein [Bryobacterales bacterium]